MSCKAIISPKALADVCEDCGKEHCGYMVHSEIWQSAGLSKDQPCCLICLQKRLGRPLTAEDLDFDSPCNLFVPGQIKKKVLMGMIRRLVEKAPDAKVRSATNSVMKLRRKYPEGLTMRQACEWTTDQFGTHWTVE